VRLRTLLALIYVTAFILAVLIWGEPPFLGWSS